MLNDIVIAGNLSQLAEELGSRQVSEREMAEALIMAAVKNNKAAMSILLACGANPNAVPASGDYIDYSPLYAAASHGHVDAVKLLIDAGAIVDLAPPSHGMTPLAVAVDFEADTASQSGLTPVMNVSRMLLDAGANPLLPDLRGVSALSLAQSYGFVAAINAFTKSSTQL